MIFPWIAPSFPRSSMCAKVNYMLCRASDRAFGKRSLVPDVGCESSRVGAFAALRLADRNFCRRYASQLTNLSISLPSAEERPNPAGVRLMGA